MIARGSGLGIGIGRFSRPLKRVVVIAMPDLALNSIETVCEVPPGAGVLRPLVPIGAVGVFIDRHFVVEGVDVTHSVISAMLELFNEYEGVEF
jgi:hypothetical protein